MLFKAGFQVISESPLLCNLAALQVRWYPIVNGSDTPVCPGPFDFLINKLDFLIVRESMKIRVFGVRFDQVNTGHLSVGELDCKVLYFDACASSLRLWSPKIQLPLWEVFIRDQRRIEGDGCLVHFLGYFERFVHAFSRCLATRRIARADDGMIDCKNENGSLSTFLCDGSFYLSLLLSF